MEGSYRQRFRIEGERERGVFNLVIESVQDEDAGEYECQDHGGIGDTKSANIVVLVDSEIVVSPLDTEVPLNHSTYLNCTTGNRSLEVSWYHYRTGDLNGRRNVYEGGIMEHDYRQRFRIEGERGKGEFNLVIESVQGEDAGEYECQDEEGMEDRKSANIIVLEDNLQCLSDAKESGVVGLPNDYGLSPDFVRLSCRVRYRGLIPPELKWRVRNGESNDFISGNDSLCWTSTNEHFCNMTISADGLQLSQTSFICETSRTIGGQQMNCTVDRRTNTSQSSESDGGQRTALYVPWLMAFCAAIAVAAV